MKLKYLTFINCYSVVPCATFIALAIYVLCSNSNIITVNRERSDVKNENSSIFLTSYNKINNESLTNSVPLMTTLYSHASIVNKQTNLDDLKERSESKAINQNETLSSILKKSDGHTKRNESEVLLYRKRRYLLFPEGSSFQIVFDLIIPIVDFTNYAIMGITCAVAWELPSKPPSEIENDLIEKLNDGTFGLSRNDSVDGIQYIDTPHHQKVTQDRLSNIIYIQPSEYAYQRLPSKTPPHRQSQVYHDDRVEYNDHKKYTERPVYINNQRPVYITSQQRNPTYFRNPYNPQFKLKSINNKRIDAGTSPDALLKYNYAKRPSVKGINREPSKTRANKRPNKNSLRQHAVYHIMGKRSVQRSEPNAEMQNTNPWLEKLDGIHLQYHRSSRHALYSKIEIMLNRQGKNGTECILRALCETGQKRHEKEPGGLLTEILRAIFTLPEADAKLPSRDYHPKHKAWDEAHWNHCNCSEVYPNCEQFVWNSKYIF